MEMCRLKSLLTVSMHTVFLMFGFKLAVICVHCWNQALLTESHSAAECSRDRVNASAPVSSRRATVWTVIRVDKRSVWRDSNESRGFVPLLENNHYIKHFKSFYHRPALGWGISFYINNTYFIYFIFYNILLYICISFIHSIYCMCVYIYIYTHIHTYIRFIIILWYTLCINIIFIFRVNSVKLIYFLLLRWLGNFPINMNFLHIFLQLHYIEKYKYIS